MKYLVGNFLYRECKYMDGFDLCSNPFAMNPWGVYPSSGSFAG